MKSLEAAIKQLRSDLNIEVAVNYLSVNELVGSLEDKPDVVVLFAENRLNPEDENVETWMNAEDAVTINDYVKNGGSWLAWHSGLASYENIESYTDMLRGYFLHHPSEHQMVKYTADPSANFLEVDEQFEYNDLNFRSSKQADTP